MNLITVVGKTYEEAVKRAHIEYGDNLRFISRKIIQKKSFLGINTGKYCELTCYLISDQDNGMNKNSSEKDSSNSEKVLIDRFVNEAKTPDPNKNVVLDKSSLPDYVFDRLKFLTSSNDLSDEFSKAVINEVTDRLLRSYLGSVDVNNINKTFKEGLVSLLKLNNSGLFKPSSQIIMVGPPGSGKTLNSARLTCLYNSGEDMKSCLGYFGKKYVSDVQNVSVQYLKNTEDFRNLMIKEKPRVLVLDTNESVDDIGRTVISYSNLISETDFTVYLNMPATMKYQDMLLIYEKYKILKPVGLIFSFMDLTSNVGNVVSFIWKSNLPVLFVSEGSNLSSGIQSPIPSYFINKLKID